MGTNQITVAEYLVRRLHEIGVRHLFSIPGDYVVEFLEAVDASDIQRIGNTNEMEAGYAADGYARIHGIGAVAVTYGVGAFSLLNTIAGASVEQVPIVVITGSPSTAQRQQDRDTGLLWHHMMVDGNTTDLLVYDNVTVAAVQIDDPFRAPLNIDSALSTCLSQQQPVYLEMFDDVYSALVDPPSAPLPRRAVLTNAADLQTAVAAAVAKLQAAKSPVIWGGVEIQRQGLQDLFEAFAAQTGIPFVTSLLGKSIVSEDNPLFAGVFDGLTSRPDTLALVNGADCLLSLGVWMTDFNLIGVTSNELGGLKPWGDDEISACRDAVRVGTAYFAQVGLGDFIQGLASALADSTTATAFRPAPPPAPATPAPADPLTFDNFFGRMNQWVDESMVVVSDIGFSVLGAMDIPIRYRSGFVAQAAWASIGYAVPASIGVSYALPGKRPVVFAGDGAFHMVCQAIATLVVLEQSPVLFVMNNGIYGVEQWLVNAAVFGSHDPSQVLPLNRLRRWEFSKLTEVFGGGDGYRVSTAGELAQALAAIGSKPDRLAIVDVRLPELSLPANALWKVNQTSSSTTSKKGPHHG